MGKYDPLRTELRRRDTNRVTMRFEEIAAIVGNLPRSAREHRAWWSNEHRGRHVQAHAWLDAGYGVDSVDLDQCIVTFARGR